MFWSRLVPLGLCLALGGCGSIGAIGIPFGKPDTGGSPQQMSAPTQPIQTSELPPLTGTASDADARNPYPDVAGGSPNSFGVPPDGDATFRGSDGQTIVAGLPPADPSGEIKRTDLLGGWTLAVNTDSCQLFMTLTSWTGGYRASTRGCASDMLKSISAWTLNGNQVVLAGNNGVAVARLFPSSSNRFDGQTEQDQMPITFFR